MTRWIFLQHIIHVDCGLWHGMARQCRGSEGSLFRDIPGLDSLVLETFYDYSRSF